MTPGEREQMEYLCRRIESEQDPIAFDRLVKELNDLLEGNQRHIDPEQKAALS